MRPWDVLMEFESVIERATGVRPDLHSVAPGGQLKAAKELLRACAQSEEEVKALLQEYAKDDWLVRNRVNLWAVVSRVGQLRHAIALEQAEKQPKPYMTKRRRRRVL